jgi:hypothetical protein
MNWVDCELQKMKLNGERLLEFQLIFACAKTLLKNSETSDPRYLPNLLSLHSTDWRNFLELVHENRLTPFVYRVLRTLPETYINTPCDGLKQRWQRNSMHMLKMSSELARLIRRFSDNDIRAIAFKGPALSMQVYGEVNMRFCSDLDLLVSPDDYEKAETLLLQDGYAYLPGEVAFKRRVMRKPVSVHTHFVHPQNNTHVEVHFALLHGTDLSVFNFDDLWREQVAISVANTIIPTLLLPWHALYLAIHGEHHSWERLGRLYDIAAIIDRMSPEEIADLMVLAVQHGQKLRLMNALLLAHLFFGLNHIPEWARAKLSNARIRAYMGRVLQMTTAPMEFQERPIGRKHWLRHRIRWTACPTVMEKLRYLIVLFMPSEGDISRISLPDRLYGLHYFLRPIWVLKRKIEFLLKSAR